MNAQAQVLRVQTSTRPESRSASYARCINASRRARWDIDADVIRGRRFDLSQSFLPAGLSMVEELGFLDADGKRLLSQVQGRTYANLFGLVERFVNAKVLDVSRDHWFGDQTALEALIRFSDEELKHQELFRRIEALMADVMPAGYRVVAEPNAVAGAVLSKSTWAVLGLVCCIELFTQRHYTESIQPQKDLSPLWKDVFMFHWKEECQHALLDELEWQREDAKLTPAARDRAVDDLIALVGAVDSLLQAQAVADVDYFIRIAGREFSSEERSALDERLLRAYRWQYIGSGVTHPYFQKVLGGLIDAAQSERIGAALAPILR
jgi:hypothetical protein